MKFFAQVLSVSPLGRSAARAHGRQTSRARMNEYAALRASVMDSPPYSPLHARSRGLSGSFRSSASPDSDASPPPTSTTTSAGTTRESEESVLETSALRSTTTTAEEDEPQASTRTGHKEDKKKKEKEKERRELSNLFKASTSKIGPALDLALETGRVEVSLERSVREERFAHVRLVGARGAWGAWGGGGALGGSGLGAGAGQRMGFKYDPCALREAVCASVDAGGNDGKVVWRRTLVMHKVLICDLRSRSRPAKLTYSDVSYPIVVNEP